MKKLSKKHKEKLVSYRHCEFLDRLITKTKTYEKTQVYEVNESFTSKTCCNCGELDNNLGSKKEYKCPNCKIHLLRDINGAVNIMLRYFTNRAKLCFEN